MRQAKVDVVVRQFEQQLIKEAELEEKRNTEKPQNRKTAKPQPIFFLRF